MDVLDTLRVKCPWDAKQTNESLRENTIEEVFELCDALIKGDNAEIRKELGDVLLHVFFYAKIGEEKGAFDIVDVSNALADKLIFRHPHVYGQVEADTAHKVEQNWEQLKLKEKDGNRSILAGVPGALPALIKAYRIQQKAANAGFDWEQPADVWAKVKEEIAEFSSEAEKFQGKESLGRTTQKNGGGDGRRVLLTYKCRQALRHPSRHGIGTHQQKVHIPVQPHRATCQSYGQNAPGNDACRNGCIVG